MGSDRLFEGRYRIRRPLARGGMGDVYLATQEPLARPVAIKILREAGLDPTFRRRFFAEARICAALAHPNLVTLLDYGESPEGRLFMVLEYVEGETLDRLLGREVRLDPGRATALLRQVASALHHVHRAGVVHRDLKPANIVVRATADGEAAKLLDFGIAKFGSEWSEGPEDPEWTGASRVLGTPRFMAPEQIRKQPLDGRTDLYALGVIAHWMLAGRPPFEGDDDATLMHRHLTEPPPSLPPSLARAESELDFLVRRSLAKRPADRPEDADAWLRELSAAEGLRRTAAAWAAEVESGLDEGAEARAGAAGGWRPWGARWAVAAALALGGAGAIAWLGRGVVPPSAGSAASGGGAPGAPAGGAAAETAVSAGPELATPDRDGSRTVSAPGGAGQAPEGEPEAPRSADEAGAPNNGPRRTSRLPSSLRSRPEPASPTGAAASEPASAPGAAGSEPASASGAAASERASAPGVAGSEPASAPGAAASERASASGAAGSEPAPPVRPEDDGPQGRASPPPERPPLRLPEPKRRRIPIVD
mgnify:CR=1 FL=1